MSASFTVDGLDELLRAMRGAPRELNREMRQAGKEVAEPVAKSAKTRAVRASRQLAAVAPTIRTRADRIPVIMAGGARRVTSSGASAGDVFFGANFGSNRYPQFPRSDPDGKTIFPALKAAKDTIAHEYLDAVERVFKR